MLVDVSAGFKAAPDLEADDVEAAVDVDVFARDAAGQVAEEEHGGLADLVAVDVTLQGALALDVGEHLVDPADGHGAEGADGPGGNRVHADLALAEFEDR